MMSIRRLLLFAALCTLPACTSAPPADAGAQAYAALESFYAAMKPGDAAAVMAHIAPGAIFVESGIIETREEYEKNHLPADIGFEKQVSGVRKPVQITTDGNTAWIVAETAFDGTFEGSPISFVSTQLAVLTLMDGRWLIRSIHWSSRR